MEVQFHAYLAAVLDNEEWLGSCSAESNLGKSVAGPTGWQTGRLSRIAMNYIVKTEISAPA